MRASQGLDVEAVLTSCYQYCIVRTVALRQHHVFHFFLTLSIFQLADANFLFLPLRQAATRIRQDRASSCNQKGKPFAPDGPWNC